MKQGERHYEYFKTFSEAKKRQDDLKMAYEEKLKALSQQGKGRTKKIKKINHFFNFKLPIF